MLNETGTCVPIWMKLHRKHPLNVLSKIPSYFLDPCKIPRQPKEKKAFKFLSSKTVWVIFNFFGRNVPFALFCLCENLKNLLLRKKWADFQIILKKCFLGIRFLLAMLICLKTWPQGGRAVLPYMAIVKTYKIFK